MVFISAQSRSPFARTGLFFQNDAGLKAVAAIPLLLGIGAGGVIGLYSASVPDVLSSFSLLSDSAQMQSFAQALLRAFQYLLLAALFSTSYLGVLLLPLLSLLRGFSFGCSVAALFSARAYSGLLFAALSVGVPAMLQLPCFMLAVCDCFQMSRCLLPGRRTERGTMLRGTLRHLALILPLCLAEAVYCYFLLPLLLNKLF